MPIPDLPLFRHRDTVVTPADQNQFVTQFETTIDTLSNGVIPAINLATTDIDAKVITATTARDESVSAKNIAVAAKDEALTAVATLQEGAIDDTIIAPNKAFSNQKTNQLLGLKLNKDFSSFVDKPTPDDTDNIALQETGGLFKKLSFANLKLWILSLFNPTLTANANLTGADNKIVMNGIVTALGLEIGDVIQFTSVANANNQKMRTVDNIINNNEIIVNYEHCGNRGNGELKLTDKTLTNATIKRISKYYNATLGLGQAPVDIRNFRVVGTEDWGNLYTNLLNRPYAISFVTTDANDSIKGCAIRINELLYATNVTGQVAFASSAASVNAIIPIGANYRLMKQNTDTVILIRETR